MQTLMVNGDEAAGEDVTCKFKEGNGAAKKSFAFVIGEIGIQYTKDLL